MFAGENKKRLVVIGTVLVLMLAGLIIGCSNTITGNDSLLNSTSGETNKVDYIIDGKFITEDEFEHFKTLMEVAIENKNSSAVLEMIKERHQLTSTRNNSDYLTAMEFVVDNWNLVESGQRTAESLLLIAGLVFDKSMSVSDANNFATSSQEITSCSYVAQPDALRVCVCKVKGCGGNKCLENLEKRL